METSYRAFVEAQVYQNPCLGGLASFLSCSSIQPFCSNTIECVDFSVPNGMKATRRTTTFEECLSEISGVIEEPGVKTIRRIILLEDITPYMVERLGQILNINPLFFATYTNTSFTGIDKAPPPPPISLFPTRFASNDSIHLHYQRVIKIPSSIGCSHGLYEFKSPSNVPRSIRCLPSLSGTQPGLIRTCCSVLLKVLNEKSWICLMLVDPTDANLTIRVLPSRENGQNNHVQFPQEPLQGGFEDFEELRKYSEFSSTAKNQDQPHKSSLVKSILHYYRNLPPGFDPANPSIMALSYYSLRIAAAEWMSYTLLMSCYVKLFEYNFRDSEQHSTEADITDLQRWRRRAKQSAHKLYLVDLFMSKQLDTPASEPHCASSMLSNKAAYVTLREDFRYISAEIEHYSRSLEQIIPVAATIVQLKAARRSITEAVNVRYITYLALVFVPLTFASGLFSMQDGFLPGQGSFVTYVSVAVPLVVGVLALSFITPTNLRNWLWKSRK